MGLLDFARNLVSGVGKILDNPVTRAAAPIVSKIAPVLAPGIGQLASFGLNAVTVANAANAPSARNRQADQQRAFLARFGVRVPPTTLGSAVQQVYPDAPPSVGGSLVSNAMPIYKPQITTMPQLIGNMFPVLPGAGTSSGGGGLFGGAGSSGSYARTGAIGGAPRGTRAVLDAYGNVCYVRKHRRMNPLNPRAARRAIRRVRAVRKMLQKIDRQLPTRTVHAKPAFARRRK